MTRSALSLAAALSLALVTAPSFAQGQDFSKVEIKTTQLAPDFWTLEGQGGTISVLAGPMRSATSLSASSSPASVPPLETSTNG